MPVVSALGAMSSRGFGEFNQQATGKYIEDYFSTYLYTGTGTSQTITNNISLINTGAWNTYYINSVANNDVAVDSSGSIYNCGDLLRKQTSTGAFSWSRIPALSGTSMTINGVVVGSTGDVYAAGFAFDGSVGQSACIVKYDTSGNLTWSRYLPNSSVVGSYLYDITIDSSDNIYVCGYYVDSGGTYYGYVAKFNSSGTVQFQRTARNGGSNQFNGICLDSSGNIYACGMLGANFITAKWDSSGTFQWARQLADTTVNASEARRIIADSSGNVYPVGYATRAGAQYVLIAKYDTSGNLQWQRKSSNTANSLTYGRGVVIDSLGNLYVSANTFDSSAVNSYATVYKYDTSGNLQKQYVFSYTGNDSYGYGATIDSSSNVYFATTSASKAYTIKFNSTATNIAGVAFYSTGVPSADVEAAGTATNSNITPTTSNVSLSYSSGLTSSNATNGVASYSQAEATGDGMVWIKDRTSALNHAIFDTSRGIYKYLSSNTTTAQTTNTGSLTNFLSNGFIVAGLNLVNNSTDNMVSWTWRKTPKFFDVVTYTGNGVSGRQISHNLGSVPGMIIVKCTSSVVDWVVQHTSLSTPGQYLRLNTTAAVATNTNVFNANPTSTYFQVGASSTTNNNGDTYVAYLFAHNAGGFGLDGTQNVISCGSFTTDGSGNATVNLGWEPQFLLTKPTDAVVNWWVKDNMRGWSQTKNVFLYPNITSSDQDGGSTFGTPTATGFTFGTPGQGTNNTTFIYMAIRRGPMKVPTDATTVFSPNASSAATGTQITTNFPVDMQFEALRAGDATNSLTVDRLRGTSTTTSDNSSYLTTSSTAAEGSAAFAARYWNNTGFQMPSGYGASSAVFWSFRRAPGFMDEVCYSGTGTTTQNVTHNLGVQPELIIYKSRSNDANWIVHTPTLISQAKFLWLNSSNAADDNSTQGYTNSGAPTSTLIKPGLTQLNQSGWTYVAYLFATCAGVSKVGTYTGTGATQTINCGFTGGARYVLIKRTDLGGSWWAWDTARGMVAGTDPRLAYNSSAAETNANWVYTTTTGFQIVTSDSTVNASGGTYIYLAIA